MRKKERREMREKREASYYIRGSLPEAFCKRTVLTNFAKFALKTSNGVIFS